MVGSGIMTDFYALRFFNCTIIKIFVTKINKSNFLKKKINVCFPNLQA